MAETKAEGDLLTTLWILTAENTRLKQENESLSQENKFLSQTNESLSQEKAEIEAMMEMANQHADGIGSELIGKVDDSVKEIEERVRLISEVIPVPIVIFRVSDGKFMYGNKRLCRVFGLDHNRLSEYAISDIYENNDDKEIFFNLLSEKDHVNNFEVRLKKSDSAPVWAVLFTQSMRFRDEDCVMTVIYDQTERKMAEEKIRRLTEELEILKEKEEKYLVVNLEKTEYAVNLSEIKEIIPIMPLTRFVGCSDFIKGLINLRGRLIPVADLRFGLGLEAADFTDHTCIVIASLNGNKSHATVGMIVDSVSQIMGIKRKNIQPAPKYLADDPGIISGMATVEEKIKILLDINRLWEQKGWADLCPDKIRNENSTHSVKRNCQVQHENKTDCQHVSGDASVWQHSGGNGFCL